MDDLTQALRGELFEPAADVVAPPDLSQKARRRAAGIRRRRMAVAVAIPVAVLALSTPFIRTAWTNRPSVQGSVATTPGPSGSGDGTSTTQTSPSTAPTSEQPALAVVRGDVLTWAGRTIPLPAGWAVLSLVQTQDRLVLDVSLVDERFTAIATADGVTRRLDAVRPPLAVSRDGTTVAGRAPVGSGGLVLVDLTTGSRMAQLSASDGLHVVRFIGSDISSVLVAADQGGPQLWSPANSTVAPVALPLNRDRLPVAVDGDGTTWFTVDDAGRLSAETPGAARPRWTSDVVAAAAADPSPDGTRLAVQQDQDLVVVDTASGAVRSRTALPVTGPVWDLTWETDSSVLAADRAGVSGTLLRCDAGGAGCVRVEPPPGTPATGEPIVAHRPFND